MILYPNCTINIGLRVIRKREDGYHDLETIFYPIHGLTDRLEVTASERFSFEQAGIAVDCAADDNLLIKCYRRMQAHYPQIGNVRIRFEKRIPFGAGLGGGSSDAAHMAIALNELFRYIRDVGDKYPFYDESGKVYYQHVQRYPVGSKYELFLLK